MLIKKPLSLMLALVMVLALTPTLPAHAAENRHPLAISLNEFFTDAKGGKYACLVDINNDGVSEMFAVKEVVRSSSSSGWGGMKKCFFYMHNGNLETYEEESAPAQIGMFISSQNYLVSRYWGEDRQENYVGFSLTSNGLDTKAFEIYIRGDGSFVHNGKKITKAEFNNYQKQYGVYKIGTHLPGYSWMKEAVYHVGIPDQTAEILSMTIAPTAALTTSAVIVNGTKINLTAYNIEGNNYFKLRDIAKITSGSGKQFEVTWDGKKNAINLISGKEYTVVGGEFAPPATSGNQTATPTNSAIYIDSRPFTPTAYNIGGNNYFKLRDIGETFNFGVDWDGANNAIVIDINKGYIAG